MFNSIKVHIYLLIKCSYNYAPASEVSERLRDVYFHVSECDISVWYNWHFYPLKNSLKAHP